MLLLRAHTWIWAHAPAGHDIGWRECRLFCLREIVIWVFVECDLSERYKREILFGYRSCSVENVCGVVLRQLRVDDLCVNGPRWEVFVRNRFKQILGGTIWILTCESNCLCLGEVCNTLVSLKMYLDVVERSVLLLTRQRIDFCFPIVRLTSLVNLYVLIPKMLLYLYDTGVVASLKRVIKALYPSGLLLK